MVSWYAIIYGGMCSKEYKESTYVSVKCGRFKKLERAWLDALMMDMDTWLVNYVKFFQLIEKDVYFKALSTITFRLIEIIFH